jgi:hypothetical protein
VDLSGIVWDCLGFYVVQVIILQDDNFFPPKRRKRLPSCKVQTPEGYYLRNIHLISIHPVSILAQLQ